MYFLTFLLLLLTYGFGYAQTLKLEVVGVDCEVEDWSGQGVVFPREVPDSLALKTVLEEKISDLQGKSYLTASVDSVVIKEGRALAYLYMGERWKWASVKNGNVPENLLRAADVSPESMRGWVYYKQLVRWQKRLVRYMEKRGYPFARVYLDSLNPVPNEGLEARLYLDKGPEIRYGTLKIITKKEAGESEVLNLKASFLMRYLDIRAGDLYDEQTVKQLVQRVNALPYVRIWKTPFIRFKGKEALIQLFLAPRKSSKVDVLVGLLPDQDPITGVQRFQFTGDVNIDLLNPFGTGKRMKLQWQRLRASTSDFKVQLQWPYVLSTPLGLDMAFELNKRDSAFIDIVFNTGVEYLFSANNSLKLYWLNTTTNLINIDEVGIQNSRQLPSSLDMTNRTFGLAYTFNKLNRRINPTRGFYSLLDIGFGVKSIRENPQITAIEDPLDPAFSFSELYDTLRGRSVQYRIGIEHKHFIPLWDWSTALLQFRSKLMYAEEGIFLNELYRIGGNKLLRGFNEASLFANWYNVFTFEWRFLFGERSYGYAFLDYAYTERKQIEKPIEKDWPYGFGIGVALETRAGLFTLSYALGAAQQNPISFRNNKVHFGYIYAF